MKLTNKFNILLKAIKSDGILHCTKDNRYTTTIYDENGFSKHMDLIALEYKSIIDTDVQNIIDDSTTKDYFQAKEPNCICIPLVTNYTSNEEITRNLSADFVYKYVTLYNLEEDLLPINPFLFNDTTSRVEIKNRITAMLSAPFDDLSSNQVNTLKQAISETLSQYNGEFDILGLIDTLSCEDEEDKNKGNSRVKKNVCNKIYPLAEDIINSTPTNQIWKEFIHNSNDIIIISMSNSSDSRGNKMIDLLLMSLFIYQRENTDTHLNVFIDEIQNQNLTSSGPITKVLKEGRKYQMSLIYATQTISKSSSEKTKILKQASTSIYFKPDITSIDTIAEFLHLNNKDKYKLDELTIGQCFVQGDIYDNNVNENTQGIIKGNVYMHYNSFNKK